MKEHYSSLQQVHWYRMTEVQVSLHYIRDSFHSIRKVEHYKNFKVVLTSNMYL